MYLIKRTVSLFSLLLGLHRDSKITANWARRERGDKWPLKRLMMQWKALLSLRDESNSKNHAIFVEKSIFWVIQRHFTSVKKVSLLERSGRFC